MVSYPKATEARGVVGANPQVMVEWRDCALDAWATGDPVKQRFLRDARAIEADEGVAGQYRLLEWTAERLPETIGRRTTDSSLLAPRDRRDVLRFEFQSIAEEDQHAIIRGEREGPGRPAEWLSVIAVHEKRLGPLAVRRLRKHDRERVIATERGKIRAPLQMALHLLHLACRPLEQDFDSFRRQLDALPRKPRAL